jgi:hypothetical protein
MEHWNNHFASILFRDCSASMKQRAVGGGQRDGGGWPARAKFKLSEKQI